MADRKNLALRPGWRKLKLLDICEEISIRINNPSESTLDRFVGLEHMETGETKLRNYGETTDLVSPMKLFRAGDILIARRNVYLKRAAFADFDGVCSGDAIVLRPKKDGRVIDGILPLILNTDGFWDYAIKHAAGTMSKRLSVDNILSFEFDIPPVADQERVLMAVSALDDCIASSRQLHAQGGVLLQSLLNRMWNTFPKRKIGALVEEGLIAPPQDGNHGEKHPKASDYVQDGVPFVMASDLRDGVVDFVKCSKIPEALALTLRTGFAKTGDILLSHKGTVGEVARVGVLAMDFVMLTPQVTYYRVIDEAILHPGWLYFAFQTPGFRRLLEQYGKQSTRAYVGITTQRELSIPMADVPDQVQMLAELVATENAISAAARRTAALIQVRQNLIAESLA